MVASSFWNHLFHSKRCEWESVQTDNMCLIVSASCLYELPKTLFFSLPWYLLVHRCL
uniref:Uncharacterized protein n=1 Tax=Rhizophora mucronata TaxID=61149 RepID=A0A2P2P1V5_RHIMU